MNKRHFCENCKIFFKNIEIGDGKGDFCLLGFLDIYEEAEAHKPGGGRAEVLKDLAYMHNNRYTNGSKRVFHYKYFEIEHYFCRWDNTTDDEPTLLGYRHTDQLTPPGCLFKMEREILDG